MRARRILFASTVVASLGGWLGCNLIFDIEPGNLTLGSEGGSGDTSVDGAVADTSVGFDAADAADAAPPPLWMFVSSDFSSKAEVTLVTPGATPTLLKHITLSTNDAVAYASGGRAFILNRGSGVVYVLNQQTPSDDSKITQIKSSPDGGYIDPVAVVVANGKKAYVLRYATNRILPVDLSNVNDAGFVGQGTEIDLTKLVASNDPDGLVEMIDGVLDPVSQHVFVALQRIHPIGFPNNACTMGSLLVEIDPTNDTLVGLPIVLAGDNPLALILDAPNHRVLAVDNGCVPGDGGAYAGAGIEEVDLLSRNAKMLLSANSYATAPTALLYLAGDSAYVETGVAKPQWNAWNPTQSSLGNVVSLPLAPFADGTDAIIGVVNESAAIPDAAAWATHRITSQATLDTQVLPNLFSKVNIASPYSVTSALLR